MKKLGKAQAWLKEVNENPELHAKLKQVIAKEFGQEIANKLCKGQWFKFGIKPTAFSS